MYGYMVDFEEAVREVIQPYLSSFDGDQLERVKLEWFGSSILFIKVDGVVVATCVDKMDGEFPIEIRYHPSELPKTDHFEPIVIMIPQGESQ